MATLSEKTQGLWGFARSGNRVSSSHRESPSGTLGATCVTLYKSMCYMEQARPFCWIRPLQGPESASNQGERSKKKARGEEIAESGWRCLKGERWVESYFWERERM